MCYNKCIDKGVIQMKEGKLGAVNSYYQYKQKKLRRRKSIILFSTILLIILTFLVTRGFKLNLDISFLVGKGNHTEIKQGVYLQNAHISYDLYTAPKIAKGIYIPARKIHDTKKYIKLANRTQVNSFVIDVKDDKGYLTFATDNEELIQKGVVLAEPPIEEIHEIMNDLYEANIYPIARVVAFKDNVLAKKEPERAVKQLNGQIYTTGAGDTWLDPYNKENWEYLLQVSLEAARVGFKEIQFDYVRFHESMNENRVALNDKVSKTEIIAAFTKYICENLQKEGIKVSADVFGAVVISDIDAGIVGQDFIEMSKYLDYICPMVYPSHYAEGTFGIDYPNADPYHIILKNMKVGQAKIDSIEGGRRAVMRPWLQDFTIDSLKPYVAYDMEEIKAQIQGANDAGVQEWLFWNAAGSYTEDGLIKP